MPKAVRIILVVLAAFAINITFRAYREYQKRSAAEPEYTITRSSADDATMNKAIADARARLPQFLQIARTKPAGTSDFNVKVGFPIRNQPGSTEHMWVRDFKISQGKYDGILDIQPVDDVGYRLNDPVSFTEAQISDWTFKKDGKIFGGFTACASIRQQSPENQAKILKIAPYQC